MKDRVVERGSFQVLIWEGGLSGAQMLLERLFERGNEGESF